MPLLTKTQLFPEVDTSWEALKKLLVSASEVGVMIFLTRQGNLKIFPLLCTY